MLFTSLILTPDLSELFLRCFRFPEVWSFRKVNKEVALHLPRMLHTVEWNKRPIYKSFPRATELVLHGTFSSPLRITKGQFPRLRNLVLLAKAPSIEIDPRIHLQELSTFFNACIDTTFTWEFLKHIYVFRAPEWLKKVFQQKPLQSLQTFGSTAVQIQPYWEELFQLAPNLEIVRCSDTGQLICVVPKLSEIDLAGESIRLLHPMVLESIEVQAETLDCEVSQFPYLHTFYFTTPWTTSMLQWIERLPWMPQLKHLKLEHFGKAMVDLQHNPKLELCSLRHVDVMATSHAALNELRCSDCTEIRVVDCPNLDKIAITSAPNVLVLQALPALKEMDLVSDRDWTSREIVFDIDWTTMKRFSCSVFENSLYFSVSKTLERLDQCTNLKRVHFQFEKKDEVPIVPLLEKVRTMSKLQECSFQHHQLHKFQNRTAIDRYLQSLK